VQSKGEEKASRRLTTSLSSRVVNESGGLVCPYRRCKGRITPGDDRKQPRLNPLAVLAVLCSFCLVSGSCVWMRERERVCVCVCVSTYPPVFCPPTTASSYTAHTHHTHTYTLHSHPHRSHAHTHSLSRIHTYLIPSPSSTCTLTDSPHTHFTPASSCPLIPGIHPNPDPNPRKMREFCDS
jgi:hypothetical protein